MNGRDEEHTVERNNLMLDKLLNAALKSSEWITDFMNETEPTSEDFLMDRIQFEKETNRLDGFDKRFGKIMEGRAMEDEGPCFAGMRSALGGLVMLLKENVFDSVHRDIPAMEDLDHHFRIWIEKRRHLAERMDEEDVCQALEEVECCLKSMPLSYNLDENWPEEEDDISETTMSSNSDNDYFTPLQSRVSSFATDYSDSDEKLSRSRQNPIIDFTAIVERFSHYNDILIESLSVIETTLDWATTTSSHSSSRSSGSHQNSNISSNPFACNNILCNETFPTPALWSTHTTTCPNLGTRLPLHGTSVTHKCTFSSCPSFFPSLSALLSHEQSHHAIHLCTVPTCGTAFYSPSIASEHAFEVHHTTTTHETTTVLYTPLDKTQIPNKPLAFHPNHALLFALPRTQQTLPRTTTIPTSTIPTKPSGNDWSPSHWLPQFLPLTRTTTAHKLSRSVGSLSPQRDLLSPHLTIRDRSKSTTSLFPLLSSGDVEGSHTGGGEGAFGLQRSRSTPGEGWTRPRLEDLEVLGVGSVGGARSLWMTWAEGVVGHGAGVGGFLD